MPKGPYHHSPPRHSSRPPYLPLPCLYLLTRLRIPKVTAHHCDVADPASVDACISEVLSQHGKIDNLVTSAGFTENFEATEYPIDRVRKLWGVNVDGTYLFATAVAKHLVSAAPFNAIRPSRPRLPPFSLGRPNLKPFLDEPGLIS